MVLGLQVYAVQWALGTCFAHGPILFLLISSDSQRTCILQIETGPWADGRIPELNHAGKSPACVSLFPVLAAPRFEQEGQFLV